MAEIILNNISMKLFFKHRVIYVCMMLVLSNVCFSQGFEYKGKVVSTSDIIDTINYIGLIDSIYGIKKDLR